MKMQLQLAVPRHPEDIENSDDKSPTDLIRCLTFIVDGMTAAQIIARQGSPRIRRDAVQKGIRRSTGQRRDCDG